MADDARPLSLADQAFANAMIAVTRPSFGQDWPREAAVDAIRELLPQVNRSHPHLVALSEAASLVLNAFAMRLGPERTAAVSTALTRAHWAAADFAMWRLGRALEAMNTTQDRNEGRAA